MVAIGAADVFRLLPGDCNPRSPIWMADLSDLRQITLQLPVTHRNILTGALGAFSMNHYTKN